jgi:hypothetical protein
MKQDGELVEDRDLAEEAVVAEEAVAVALGLASRSAVLALLEHCAGEGVAESVRVRRNHLATN